MGGVGRDRGIVGGRNGEMSLLSCRSGGEIAILREEVWLRRRRSRGGREGWDCRGRRAFPLGVNLRRSIWSCCGAYLHY
jgi:hypothetical protein